MSQFCFSFYLIPGYGLYMYVPFSVVEKNKLIYEI